MRKRFTSVQRTYSGRYEHIQLDYTPDAPLAAKERYAHKANYLTTMAKIHFYLNGEDVLHAVPSGHMLFILDHLLNGIDTILQGQTLYAHWFSDPYE